MIALLVIAVIAYVVIFLFLKPDNALKNQLKILMAIDKYAEETDDVENALRLIDAVESYAKTLFRFWDWGYKNILPKEDFELIKPYIKEQQKCWAEKK